MEAKQAVDIAKRHILDLFSDESIAPPTLEEIWLEPSEGVWLVTLGVRRPFGMDTAASRLGLSQLPDYKVVRVSDADGRPISVRDRLAEALRQ